MSANVNICSYHKPEPDIQLDIDQFCSFLTKSQFAFIICDQSNDYSCQNLIISEQIWACFDNFSGHFIVNCNIIMYVCRYNF